MKKEKRKPIPAIVAIFGANGDLAKRKLVPALFNLYLDKALPENFHIFGIGRESDDKTLREAMRLAVTEHSRRKIENEDTWNEFAAKMSYISGVFEDQKTYDQLAKEIAKAEKEWAKESAHLYYLATPPFCIEMIVGGLEKADLTHDKVRDRIVIEKPFGHDLESAQELNAKVTKAFEEHQIYRIDHYLGKETVQNMLAFRFANGLFEPVWDRRYIDHVQITVAEDIGVEHRGKFYESAGALRDIVQNHLLQVMCLVAMEPPVSIRADEVRNKKLDVLNAVRPIDDEGIHQSAVRGQYAPGWSEGEKVVGYRQEEGVAPKSSIETFAAVKLFIDNWRWQGVPFYLRTGKRLPTKFSQISIEFKPVPHQMFPAGSGEHWEPNRLVINIQPSESIVLRFQAKQPGRGMRLQTVSMEFSYADAFRTQAPEAYETLLYDAINGDGTLFMRADQLEAAWRIIMPILDVWSEIPSADFPNYAAGTWGPESAEALIARDGRSWHAVPMPEE